MFGVPHELFMGRNMKAPRTTHLISNTVTFVILTLALVLDIAGTSGLFGLVNDWHLRDAFSWAAFLAWGTQTLDLFLLMVFRLLLVCATVIYFTRSRKEESTTIVARASSTIAHDTAAEQSPAVHREEGDASAETSSPPQTGSTHEVQQSHSKEDSLTHTASRSRKGDYVAVPTSEAAANDEEQQSSNNSHNNETSTLIEVEEGAADPFAKMRRRSIERAAQQKRRIVIEVLLFILLTACNMVIAIKCLFFHYPHSPYTEVLMALTVLWVNGELFCLQAVIDRGDDRADVFEPNLHPHPMCFNHKVTAKWCDLCLQRIIREGLYCPFCNFDCCLPCLKRRLQLQAGTDHHNSTNHTAAGGGGSGHRAMGPMAGGMPPTAAAMMMMMPSMSSAPPPPNNDNSSVVREMTPMRYMLRSVAFILPFWRPLTLALISLTITQFIRVFIPNLQGKVLDAIVAADLPTFWRYLKYFCVLSAITLLLGSMQIFCTMLVMRNLRFQLREMLFGRLINLDVAQFDATTVGTMTARMTSDVLAMIQPIETLLSYVINNLITLVGAIVMCLTVSWRLAMISTTIVGPIIYVTSTYASWSARLNRGLWDALAQANSTATEAFTNIRTVKSFSTEEVEKAKFAVSTREAFSRTLRDAIASSGTYIATNFMDLGASAVLLGFGGYIAVTEPSQLSVGKLVTFQLYANMMNAAYRNLNGVLNDFTRSTGAAERIFGLLDSRPSIDPNRGRVLPVLEGNVRVEHVRFTYPTRPGQCVLNDVSLDFPRNTVTAVVGRSGGGKSTLLHLLLRLYDPQAGRICVDGNDMKELQLSWLHRHYAVVAQDTQLFNGTIEANISYGVEGCTSEQIVRAARGANAHDFIASFPDGYLTTVGERGVQLSGGQRQRIAIARALLRQPRILLLDEATSALDAESEALVQQALDQLIVGLHASCTIVVVAHRLSTVMNANNIIVVHEGRVMEQGTHVELLQRKGYYWRLVHRQLQQQQSQNLASTSTLLDFDAAEVGPQETNNTNTNTNSNGGGNNNAQQQQQQQQQQEERSNVTGGNEQAAAQPRQ